MKQLTKKNSKLLSQNEKKFEKELEKELQGIEKKLLFSNKKKKRGRKVKINAIKIKKTTKINDIFSGYNMSKKIKNNFFNFCVVLANCFIKLFKKNDETETFEDKFFKLKNEYKIKVNKENDNSLKSKTLGEIIDNEISIKIKHYQKDNNKKIYEKIKNDELLKELFSVKYKHLFKIYYNSKRTINLSEYELNEIIINKYRLNKEIKLSPEIKMFRDLLENNSSVKDLLKENKIYLANKYKNMINNYAIKNYLVDSKFLIWKDYSFD